MSFVGTVAAAVTSIAAAPAGTAKSVKLLQAVAGKVPPKVPTPARAGASATSPRRATAAMQRARCRTRRSNAGAGVTGTPRDRLSVGVVSGRRRTGDLRFARRRTRLRDRLLTPRSNAAGDLLGLAV